MNIKTDSLKPLGNDKHKRIRNGVMLTALAVVFVLIIMFADTAYEDFFSQIFLLILIVYIVLLLKPRSVSKEKILTQFGKDNLWTYDKAGSPSWRRGMLFKQSDSKEYSNYFRGDFMGHRMELYDFSYHIHANTRDELEFQVRVMAVKLTRSHPNIYLDALNSKTISMHASATQDLPKSFKGHQRVQLEGDFAKHFDVYIPIGEEVNALSIFAPDVMAAIMDAEETFDLEIHGDILYFYFLHTYLDEPTYRKQLLAASVVLPEITRPLNRRTMSLKHIKTHAVLEKRRIIRLGASSLTIILIASLLFWGALISWIVN